MNNLFIRSILIDWDQIPSHSYLRRIKVLKNLTRLDFSNQVTFLVGENGSGKSTLLEAIAIAYGFNSEGGTINYTFSTYDTHSELCDALKIHKSAYRPKWGYFLRAESFYNVATAEEIYESVRSNRYHFQSHGESFLSVMQNQLKPNGLFFFDEPEAALSPQRQLSLLMEIAEHAKKGAQFIIVTHSPILLGLPGADILSFDGDKIHPISYEETDSYQITRMFINNRMQILRHVCPPSESSSVSSSTSIIYEQDPPSPPKPARPIPDDLLSEIAQRRQLSNDLKKRLFVLHLPANVIKWILSSIKSAEFQGYSSGIEKTEEWLRFLEDCDSSEEVIIRLENDGIVFYDF